MTTTIYIRYKATPITNNDAKISIDTNKPNVSVWIEDVKLTVVKDQFDFLLEQELEVSQEEIDKLKNENPSKDETDIRIKITTNLKSKIREILMRLSYYYGIKDVKENFNAIGKVEWSIDKTEWFQINIKYDYKWVIADGTKYYLPENITSWYPKLLNDQPLIAFEFLHKAFNETSTKISWILATVSAELAFKEFVSKLDPRLSYLITNIPSPPIERLYKQTLKDLAGEESPFYSELQKGAKTRNDFIHNPHTALKFPFPLDQYLLTVKSALLHLLYLLYQKEKIYAYFYNKSISELNKAHGTKYSEIS